MRAMTDDPVTEDDAAIGRFTKFADNLAKHRKSKGDILEAVHWEIGDTVVGTISVDDALRISRILAERG